MMGINGLILGVVHTNNMRNEKGQFFNASPLLNRPGELGKISAVLVDRPAVKPIIFPPDKPRQFLTKFNTNEQIVCRMAYNFEMASYNLEVVG